MALVAGAVLVHSQELPVSLWVQGQGRSLAGSWVGSGVGAHVGCGQCWQRLSTAGMSSDSHAWPCRAVPASLAPGFSPAPLRPMGGLCLSIAPSYRQTCLQKEIFQSGAGEVILREIHSLSPSCYVTTKPLLCVIFLCQLGGESLKPAPASPQAAGGRAVPASRLHPGPVPAALRDTA